MNHQNLLWEIAHFLIALLLLKVIPPFALFVSKQATFDSDLKNCSFCIYFSSTHKALKATKEIS